MGKKLDDASRVVVKTDQPAQEIADDEVEIAKTGASPEKVVNP